LKKLLVLSSGLYYTSISTIEVNAKWTRSSMNQIILLFCMTC
jgi:hypothetical protein